MKKRTWNPRFTAYAKAHGLTEEQMLRVARERFPGGVMCGFITWLSDQWLAWAKHAKHPRATNPYAIIFDDDHTAFDRWLKVPS